MEVKCFACGHQMKMIERKIKRANNGRCYITTYYKCVKEKCPAQSRYGNGVNIQETLFGIEANTEIEVEQI